MYSMGTRSDQMDSKYTVADILSSMANGEPAMSSYAGYTGVTTVTTPTLTPTTLSNIEQQFMELQSTNQTNPQDRHMQSGFVPPLIDPSASMIGTDTVKNDPDWAPSGGKKMRNNRGTAILSEADIYTPGYLSSCRKPPTRKRDDHLTPEEEHRRRMRRERNKVAAAKCRQRRVDHTNVLVNETEDLEDEKANLENEIQTLQQQKEQLEFLLQAHKPLCKMSPAEVSSLTQTSVSVSTESIKPEPLDSFDRTCVVSLAASSQNSISRPTSLPMLKKALEPSTTLADNLGVPMTTPSSGIFTFGLDSMVDGHTGLTPIMSCSSQVHKNTSDSSSPDLNSPTLISL